MARVWNWQKWGSPNDLIHQSDIGAVIGKYGCPSRLRRRKEEKAAGETPEYKTANGKLAAGNAAHAVIHRVLNSERARAGILAQLPEQPGVSYQRVDPKHVERAFDDEFAAEVNGRPVDWFKTNAKSWRASCLEMLNGLFETMHAHVAEVVMTEAAFVYQIGGVWLTGAVDLIYRARTPDGGTSPAVSFADWKTGKQRPHPIELQHGWQSGIYGNALRSAWFVPYASVPKVDGEEHRDTVERICVRIANAESDGDESELASLVERFNLRRFDEFPEQIRYVHLQDLVKYTRKTKKKLTRPEEIRWQKLSGPENVTFENGDRRGPAWYHVERSEGDTRRLRATIKSVVGWVRFGRFPAAPGELCERCRFKGPCLTDGYQPIGKEKKRLDVIQSKLDGFDGFDDDD